MLHLVMPEPSINKARPWNCFGHADPYAQSGMIVDLTETLLEHESIVRGRTRQASRTLFVVHLRGFAARCCLTPLVVLRTMGEVR